MADIRKVTDDFSVAPQITPSDAAEAARLGFKLLINNRPDGEAPDQPTSAQMEAAARAAGLGYIHIPFAGRPTPEQAAATAKAADEAGGPVLAFCRSGTRSITAWSIGEAMAGKRSPQELIELGAGAGYDLSAALRG
ncbi:MAG: TIGR01244 family sulfur transferase [Caulobacteraceae bacterium]